MIHTWANIALIFLITLSIVAWAVPLVLLFFSIKGMRGLRERTDRLIPQAQQQARQTATIVEQGSYKVVHPFIRMHAWWHGIQAAIHTLHRQQPAHINRHEDEVNS
ncbi:MAG: hypothetical protein J7M34_11035 [Anaerolineae bacterium]|nr:hypothetical protein [Anaerolineae bacterium]